MAEHKTVELPGLKQVKLTESVSNEFRVQSIDWHYPDDLSGAFRAAEILLKVELSPDGNQYEWE